MKYLFWVVSIRLASIEFIFFWAPCRAFYEITILVENSDLELVRTEKEYEIGWVVECQVLAESEFNKDFLHGEMYLIFSRILIMQVLCFCRLEDRSDVHTRWVSV